jgi:hypothetical protein
MVREVVVVIGVSALMTACASRGPARSKSSPPCTQNQAVNSSGAQGVIFPAGAGNVDGHEYGTISEYWTPTPEDIRSAEVGLQSFLTEARPAIAAKLSTYVRQYTGFRLDGRDHIFIQFLCWQPHNPEWRCHPILVDDGGDCYFRLEYDTSSGQYSRLWVNGGA